MRPPQIPVRHLLPPLRQRREAAHGERQDLVFGVFPQLQ
jgi:hypothetical protein